MRAGTVSADRPGQQPESQPAGGGPCCRHDETSVGGDKGPAMAVELDGSIAVSAGVQQGHRFKTIAFLLVEPAPVACEYVSIGRLAETQDDLAGKTFDGPVTLKPLAV